MAGEVLQAEGILWKPIASISEEDEVTCVDNSLVRSNSISSDSSDDTIRPILKKRFSNGWMDSKKTIKAAKQVVQEAPEPVMSPESDIYSTRANLGSSLSFRPLDDDFDAQTNYSDEPDYPPARTSKDFTAKAEATQLLRQGRAAIGESNYPFTIDKSTGKQYFSPSQINREIRAVTNARQHAALQHLLEAKKAGGADLPIRSASALGFFGKRTEHPNGPLTIEIPSGVPNEVSRWSPDSDDITIPQRTSSTIKKNAKRLSSLSFLSKDSKESQTPSQTPTVGSTPSMNPSTPTPRGPRHQISGPLPIGFSPQFQIPGQFPTQTQNQGSGSGDSTPTGSIAGSGSGGKARIFSIFKSSKSVSKDKGKGKELPTNDPASTNPTGQIFTANPTTPGGTAKDEEGLRFQLTPLTSLIKQSYIDLNTLRNMKGNVIQNGGVSLNPYNVGRGFNSASTSKTNLNGNGNGNVNGNGNGDKVGNGNGSHSRASSGSVRPSHSRSASGPTSNTHSRATSAAGRHASGPTSSTNGLGISNSSVDGENSAGSMIEGGEETLSPEQELATVDFDRIEAALHRFEDLYEAFLAYGDGNSGGPAEEVHLVAMICKRSDVERGGMSVPKTD